jgi:hypothetical protein
MVAGRSGSGILGAGGGFGSGLLLLVGGLVVKHAEANEVALCSSGFGRFGQALDPNVASSCSLAQDLSNGATAAIWIGAIVLAIAVIGLIAAGTMVSSKNAKIARPQARGGTRPATPPGPRAAAANEASFPAVSWDPPQDSAAPAHRQPSRQQPAQPYAAPTRPAPSQPAPSGPAPTRSAQTQLVHPHPVQPATMRPPAVPAGQVQSPRNGCGHEARPGARFCPVCGCPVADSRPAAPRPAPADPAPPAVTNGRHGRPFDAPASYPHQAGPESVAPAGRPGRHRVAP